MFACGIIARWICLVNGQQIMPLDFVFLVLEEHPYGRAMLRALLDRGFRPSLVIEEVSGVADEERAKFLTRIAGQPVPPTIASQVEEWGIPRLEVENHNSTVCHDMIGARRPDLVVLGGTRIIRSPLLENPARGTLNAHPGLLPQLRGSSSVAWALYRDLPVGSTIHYVDTGVDTGPIILRRQLPVYRGDTYEGVVRRTIALAAELMTETVALFERGTVHGAPQDLDIGETLRVIPPALLLEAKDRLAQGRYSHYADQGGGAGADTGL
jgi:methionyl-tRNA formyltransferase